MFDAGGCRARVEAVGGAPEGPVLVTVTGDDRARTPKEASCIRLFRAVP